MKFKRFKYISSLVGILLLVNSKAIAQCYPDKIVTAAFATQGASPYIDEVLWLTWGSNDQQVYPYGRHNQSLSVGSTSYASISLGDGKYMCIEAEITSISNGAIRSYAPGNYSGDYMDDLYNIGGTGTNNQLISGISTTMSTPTITIKCKASIDGEPIRIPGLVIGDAESLNETGEFINVTADGTWTLVEVKKNLGAVAYRVRKEIVFAGGNPTSRRTMKFVTGNDDNTMAVSFLKFNESAYNVTGANPDFSVNFSSTFRGGGTTAIALGLLPPTVDGGDAPLSYGKPLHLIQKLDFTSDNITPVNQGNTSTTDINTAGYTPGSLVENLNLSHLGTMIPDAEIFSQNSKDALGDDMNGPAGMNEEDAWPTKYQRFSYKAYYMPGDFITANIPYKSNENGYIAGWIDFDLNGQFDSDEKQEVYAPATGGANGSVTLEWKVPSARRHYNTFVRLRLSKTKNMDPESLMDAGEVEDHKMYIIWPAVTNPMLYSKANNN